MRDPRKKRISAGTILMLAATFLVLAGTGILLLRIGSGGSFRTDRTRQAAQSSTETAGEPGEISLLSEKTTEKPSPSPTAAPAAKQDETEKRSTLTLTVAGTVALSGDIRKDSYFSDVKQYDYYDTMTLLKKEIRGDLNVVFLENLLSSGEKATDLTATEAGAAMLKNAGFNVAACGFAKSYDKAEAGIEGTLKILREQGILPLGIFENAEDEHFRILERNGIRVAMMQYTDTIAAQTRKNMEKKGTGGMVPAADVDAIAADIARAREQGADAVLVFLNWGKTGKTPDKAMRTLAQKIADAGADLIIGNGSRIVSGAETLTAAGESGKQVLCVWSLGTVLSGDRSNIRRIAGMMIQATVSRENGRTEIRDLRYIPLYTWKYRQDGRNQYRCMAANGTVPDGMDSEQKKMMKKAADTVRNAMKDAPAEERTNE